MDKSKKSNFENKKCKYYNGSFEATAKMIDFATIISRTIDKPLQRKDFKYVSDFIRKNKKEFSIVNKQNNNDYYLKQEKDFIEENFSTSKGKLIKKRSDLEDLLSIYFEVKGIYFLWSNDTLVYIGKSVNLMSRIPQSIIERNSKQNTITHFSVYTTDSNADMHILEPIFVVENKPLLNRDFSCDDFCTFYKTDVDVKSLKRISIIEDD